jgi:hypothetical protein
MTGSNNNDNDDIVSSNTNVTMDLPVEAEAVAVIAVDVSLDVMMTTTTATATAIMTHTDTHTTTTTTASSLHEQVTYSPDEDDSEIVSVVADVENGYCNITTGESITNYDDVQRAEFISATVLKRSKDTVLGIGLTSEVFGEVTISSISSDGTLAHSPFRPGDRLLSINTKSCADMDHRTAAELLRHFEGTVNIVAYNAAGIPQTVDAMVEKPTTTTPVGAGVRRNAVGSLEIFKIVPSGLYAYSLINVGDRLVSINTVGCQGLDPQTAIDMIRATPRFVTLRTHSYTAAGAVVVVAALDQNGEGTHTDDTIALATADDVAIDDTWNNSSIHNHACFCAWMIIVSVLLISFATYMKTDF